MRRTPHFLLEDVAEVERLVRDHPWATLVSPASAGLTASHYPVLLEDTGDASISLLTHMGRPDDAAHDPGSESAPPGDRVHDPACRSDRDGVSRGNDDF